MKKSDILQQNVAVLAGGWSDEREISLASAHACEEALKKAGFARVELFDIADDDFVTRLKNGNFDVAFVAMHGRYGEDGCIQGLLEVLHIPYTFSHVLASAIATDKEFAKRIYRGASIPTPEGASVPAGYMPSDEELDEIVENYGLPLFVKPMTNGSSYGITKVTKREQLAEAVKTAGKGNDGVLIEQCIEGTEITVPVIGNDDPMGLPIIEIVTGDGADYYDLKVKYEPSELHHVVPARLPQEAYDRAQELAKRAHLALGCRGASRSDFIVTEDGTPYILETNTIPGMTETSLLPDSARRAGIPFPELCYRFVEWALE